MPNFPFGKLDEPSFGVGVFNMKLIPITQGQFAIVDDEDYEYLMQWKWSAVKRGRTYYATRQTSRKIKDKKRTTIYMHTVVNKTPKGLLTDHKDRNGLNNQKDNLRIATSTQNAQNVSKGENCSSKYLGVYLLTINRKNKTYKYYTSSINFNKKRVLLGWFPYTEEGEKQAALAYNEAAIKYNGAFASLNIIE